MIRCSTLSWMPATLLSVLVLLAAQSSHGQQQGIPHGQGRPVFINPQQQSQQPQQLSRPPSNQQQQQQKPFVPSGQFVPFQNQGQGRPSSPNFAASSPAHYQTTPKASPTNLPSPSPVSPPRQQQSQQSRQQQQQQQQQHQAPRNPYQGSLGEVQPVYQQQPQFAPHRNRFQGQGPVPKGNPPYNKPGPAKQNQLTSSEEAEYLDEEAQEPDRLTILLQTSKFQCSGKKDGYYADDTLGCEVFHYCQDGGKHSWLCPNGFAFHQVHLICVPPSSDNICKQSSQYHFVNEYLYRPINEKEAQATNTSLKYADRYYPDGYSVGVDMLPYDQEQGPPPAAKPPAPYRSRPGGGDRSNPNVFYSPESINIPLSQRRPAVRPSAQGAKPQQSYQNSKYNDEEYEDEY